MTIPELKKMYGILKKAYSALDDQAKIEGVDFTSPEYDALQSKVRENILAKWGFTLEEYQAADQEYRDSKSTVLSDFVNSGTIKVLQDVQDEISKLKNTHIPSTEEITALAHDVAKEYIKPPIINNKIVKEVTVEKPQIIKETTIEKTIQEIAYNEKPLQEKLNAISKRVDEIKIPTPIDTNKLKEELGNEFSATLAYNIDILGMPNFRKLAMGIRQDLDSTTSRVSTLESNPSTGGGVSNITITGTIDDSNVTFTSASQPTYLVINGATYSSTGGAITWSYLAGTITLSSPVGTGGSIFGLGAGGSSGTGGHTIEDEGTPLTARTNLNFVGAGVVVTDDSGNDATVVTINGGGAMDIIQLQVFS